jgi:hypothetical protein
MKNKILYETIENLIEHKQDISIDKDTELLIEDMIKQYKIYKNTLKVLSISERIKILKELENNLRLAKTELKLKQKNKNISWTDFRDVKHLKIEIRTFLIIHTILKKKPDIELSLDNIFTYFKSDFIKSLNIENSWKIYNNPNYISSRVVKKILTNYFLN